MIIWKSKRLPLETINTLKNEYWKLVFFFKFFYIQLYSLQDCIWGWSAGAKVLCILHHWGVQLILAYSWARPAILVVGKGRGGMFLFLLFLHFHSCSSFFPVPLFHLLYSLFLSLSPPISGRQHKMTLKGWRVVKPQHNQCKTAYIPWHMLKRYSIFLVTSTGPVIIMETEI